MNSSIQRRQFMQRVAAGVSALSVPCSVGAGRSLEKLRTAHIGVGGMGSSDLRSIASHRDIEVAALCDVDSDKLAQAAATHTAARKFADYREMITTMGESIDAVVVSTPDHSHAPAAMLAMNRGKPVYCQKPLTHQVYEARQLRLVAEQKQLVTQMGIQIHSAPVYRRAVRMIQEGVVGRVRHVHAWSNKNWGYDGGPFSGEHAVPDSLDWDLWLGPAEYRPFVPRVYHPANWRRLIDFGTGTLGDMGVHIFDTPYAALELTAPTWVRTTCREPTGIGHPTANVVEYEFPGTAHTTETMLWTWYDGAQAPPSADDLNLAGNLNLAGELALPDGFSLPGQGSLFVGENGVLLLPHVGEAVLFPEARFRDFKRPDVDNQDHYHQWVDACRGTDTTSADFSYSGPLTEALLLGVVANRFPGRQLIWDADDMRFTNMDDANQLLRRISREAFAVENL